MFSRKYKGMAVKWKSRAFLFAKALIDNKIQGTLEKGKSDHPFSLMEGLSGQISFLSDLLTDEDQVVRFPGYEL
jgi:hypothetical protein